MSIINEEKRNDEIVRDMYEFMSNKGIAFKGINTNGTPTATLKGETGIGYRRWSKHKEKGVVIYCAKDEIDKNALVRELNLTVYDNGDTARPYALYIPIERFEEAVDILSKNDFNLIDS